MSKAKKPSPGSGWGEGPVRVLLAEDEESFIDALVIGLTNEGSASSWRATGPRPSACTRRPIPTSSSWT